MTCSLFEERDGFDRDGFTETVKPDLGAALTSNEAMGAWFQWGCRRDTYDENLSGQMGWEIARDACLGAEKMDTCCQVGR